MNRPLLIGAVAYDPRVVPIWEGMRDYFRDAGPPIDYVLYSNYDRQVAGAARPADRHRLEHQPGLGEGPPPHKRDLPGPGHARRGCRVHDRLRGPRRRAGSSRSADLRGKRVWRWARPTPAQAAILPGPLPRQAGLDADRDCRCCASTSTWASTATRGRASWKSSGPCGESQADVGAIGDATWTRQLAKGRVDPKQIRPVWTSPGYCHCNFTVLADFPDDLGRRWTESLLAMRYDDPRWRELMDLEGLNAGSRPTRP